MYHFPPKYCTAVSVRSVGPKFGRAAVNPTSAAGMRARTEFTKSFKKKDESKKTPDTR